MYRRLLSTLLLSAGCALAAAPASRPASDSAATEVAEAARQLLPPALRDHSYLAYLYEFSREEPFRLLAYMNTMYKFFRTSREGAVNRRSDGLELTLASGERRFTGYYVAGAENRKENLGPRGVVRLYGGETLTLRGAFRGIGPDALKLRLRFTDGSGAELCRETVPALPDGLLLYSVPARTRGKVVKRVEWEISRSDAAATASLYLYGMGLLRRRVNNRLDADRILARPPRQSAQVKIHRGRPTIVVDGLPITGFGYARQTSYERPGAFKTMLTETGCRTPVGRVVVTLGEDLWNYLTPPSWIGPDQFDFSYADRYANLIVQADKNAKIIFYLVMDGAKWWNYAHPDAVGIDWRRGIPDYLSDAWRRDAADALKQFIAHVRLQPYADAVIGYELLNGKTMDCNFEVNDVTPAALERFRSFLRDRYHNDQARLRAAWRDAAVTFASATPEPLLDPVRPAAPRDRDATLLCDPARTRYFDSWRFRARVFQQIIIDFARNVKQATGGRAIVGARTGDFMGHLWNLSHGIEVNDCNPVDRLLRCPDFDFFEVQEPYIGRFPGFCGGSGSSVMPVEAAALHGKLVMIQNDSPMHTGGKSYRDTAFITTHLKRVYVNSLVNGSYPYQWEIGRIDYTRPEILACLRRINAVFDRSLDHDRSSVAEVAFVLDPEYQRYIGYDPVHQAPSRSIALFDAIKHTWARAGVPFDVIMLDQAEQARSYKVYVFIHSFDADPARRALLRRALAKGRAAIFIWADFLFDGGRIDEKTMAAAVGMRIKADPTPRPWAAVPAPALTAVFPVSAEYPLGGFGRTQDGGLGLPGAVYAPSFVVDDPTARPLAFYPGGRQVAAAARQVGGRLHLYSASPILAPALLRYACRAAGCFEYFPGEDVCYVNRSFIGVHAGRSGPLTFRLPEPSPLVNVFTGEELPTAREFRVEAKEGDTVLFFRGTRVQWQSGGN